MQSHPKSSSVAKRLRRRTRFDRSEVIEFAARDLAVLVNPDGPPAIRLRLPASDLEFTAQRLRETGELIITGGPQPTCVEFTRLKLGPRGSKPAVRCPHCRSVRLALYLVPGRETFICRVCARIRRAERRGAEAIEALQHDWRALGEKIDRLAWIRRLGEPLELVESRSTLARLKRELSALRARVIVETPQSASRGG